MDCKVILSWDSDAMVWIATSDDVPGMVLESGSFDALIEKVKIAIPELISLNNLDKKINSISFISNRMERLNLNLPQTQS